MNASGHCYAWHLNKQVPLNARFSDLLCKACACAEACGTLLGGIAIGGGLGRHGSGTAHGSCTSQVDACAFRLRPRRREHAGGRKLQRSNPEKQSCLAQETLEHASIVSALLLCKHDQHDAKCTQLETESVTMRTRWPSAVFA